jgi:hypothetical protein
VPFEQDPNAAAAPRTSSDITPQVRKMSPAAEIVEEDGEDTGLVLTSSHSANANIDEDVDEVAEPSAPEPAVSTSKTSKAAKTEADNDDEDDVEDARFVCWPR